MDFSPELLLLFLCVTRSEFPKLIIDRETVFADVSASVPTRKENMHVSYGTKRTQEVVIGLIYPCRSRMTTIKVNEYEVTANSAGSNAGTGIVRFSSNVI